MNRTTFDRVADACNLSATFAAHVSAGTHATDTGKVDFRKFARMMEKEAFMYGKDCASKYFMLPILLAKFGIRADDFRWRGNATEGIEPHGMANTFVEWCADYLSLRFPEQVWERSVSSPQVRRKDIPSDILATLDI
jgi:hypothetical protein